MSNLSTTNINELKNLGLITSTDSATALADQTVDDLKNKNYITQVIPSADIESVLTPSTIPVESISLNESELILYFDNDVRWDRFTLEATVLPEDATDKTVTWTSTSSESDGIMVFEDGEVSVFDGVRDGNEATITATAGDKSATCHVIAKFIHPNSD